MRSRRTLPRRFSERGYETTAFTANPWTPWYVNFDRDFDHFEDFVYVNLANGLVDGGLDQRNVVTDGVTTLLNWYQRQDTFVD
ncbi:hypothetical protein [Natronorubrum daqingense]|uniref:Uncharacterized protein n=1 Tax=Natronorubrum daqingense TaxID=588898 RepID=A0A1P8R985_9EURY|nr:hypothetical protein [Natronorubrum daqingense]APX95243.1 hypothetical protein BB347_00720 [Natronorubrum daqingense]